jgi:hypothetical protein
MRAMRILAGVAALLCIGVVNAEDAALNVKSSESADGLTGEIHALVDQPFAVVSAALSDPSRWCDILMLHLDTKNCRLSTDAQGTVLHVGVVSKYDQPASAAYRVAFGYHLVADTASVLQMKLDADVGPLGTSNYRIILEAAPAADGKTSISMSYSYSYGLVARIAMGVYLATFGRNKVGFTVVATEPDGQPRYIGGMRGVVERNTMRYYLAVEAYLGALSVPQAARVETSLRNWYSGIERYPRQLHEMEQAQYLDMKRKEYSELLLARVGP